MFNIQVLVKRPINRRIQSNELKFPNRMNNSNNDRTRWKNARTKHLLWANWNTTQNINQAQLECALSMQLECKRYITSQKHKHTHARTHRLCLHRSELFTGGKVINIRNLFENFRYNYILISPSCRCMSIVHRYTHGERYACVRANAAVVSLVGKCSRPCHTDQERERERWSEHGSE